MYVKLFSSILTSSVWATDPAVRVVWITMLALADRDGNVRSAPSGLARLSNVSVEQCNHALSLFLSPDTESGTKEDEGRRIEEIAAGWHILNYTKYRDLQDEETRKAQWRESSKKYRQNQRASAADQHASASGQHASAHAEAEGDAEAEAEAATETSASVVSANFDAVAALVARLPEQQRAAWSAEIRVAKEGMHGKPLTDAQVQQACRDYLGNETLDRPSLRHFRGYLKNANVTPRSPRAGPRSKLEEGRASLKRWVDGEGNHGQ